MRILIGLTYYRPHYSGLTIYTERLARGLVKLGHQVTVLTSRFNPDFPEQEVQDGVQIIRPAVALHLSKGVLMPSMPRWAYRLIRESDVINLHLPQMDAAYISWIARMASCPVVMTYHCDLMLPKGVIHWIANQGAHLASHLTALAANRIVTNTRDYAENSTFLTRYQNKMHFIPTPVDLPQVSEQDVRDFCCKYEIEPGQRVIAMNARLATEKGVEYLIEAMPYVLQKFPNARVLHVGQYQNVLGEEQYAQKLAPLIKKLGKHWAFLGVLSPLEHAAFFHASEVLVLPSINSTESFGMVQVEAMSCGTPVVASDLPGVRCAVKETGMGRIVPLRDPKALAEAIIDILNRPESFLGNPDDVRQRYSPETVARQYEALFKELIIPE
ncbi:MAG: glycosyltransferase family 4 protein [Anaerolineaceae bacterium]|nr:glycosyltransferase family 4 protein [Anaerolineaceae bacterium]